MADNDDGEWDEENINDDDFIEPDDIEVQSNLPTGSLLDDDTDVKDLEGTGGQEEEEGEFDEDLDLINLSELELSESNEDQPAAVKTPKKVLSSDAESSPESDNEEADQAENNEIPAEYWQVQRLIKYVKAGNPTATIIAMSSLRDFNLRDYYVQMAIKEAGGLEVLLNILETDENRCKIAALLVLREISSNPEISRIIYNLRVSQVNPASCLSFSL